MIYFAWLTESLKLTYHEPCLLPPDFSTTGTLSYENLCRKLTYNYTFSDWLIKANYEFRLYVFTPHGHVHAEANAVMLMSTKIFLEHMPSPELVYIQCDWRFLKSEAAAFVLGLELGSFLSNFPQNPGSEAWVGQGPVTLWLDVRNLCFTREAPITTMMQIPHLAAEVLTTCGIKIGARWRSFDE